MQGYHTWHLLRHAHGRPHERPHAWTLRPSTPDLDLRIDLADQLRTGPADLQRYAAGVLAGDLDQDYAAQEGITAGAVMARKQRWQAFLAA